jgi:hypothetical protein
MLSELQHGTQRKEEEAQLPHYLVGPIHRLLFIP